MILKQATEFLAKGDLVAIPTETVYGLAADAMNADAILKIFEVKSRPLFDPLIVHIPPPKNPSKKPNFDDLVTTGLIDIAQMERGLGSTANKLIQNFWPGPLTLILPKSDQIPDVVTSGSKHVGLRMPSHPVAQDILKSSGLYLAAPSANRFGRISPTRAEHVEEEFSEILKSEISPLKLIVDGGPCDIGIESTVVQIFSGGEVAILRPGGITKKELSQWAEIISIQGQMEGSSLLSPGLLASHYAPLSPVMAFEKSDRAKTVKLIGPNDGSLFFDTDVREYAKNLFERLRILDRSAPPKIWVELPPEGEGIEHAIRDRILRSAAKRICI